MLVYWHKRDFRLLDNQALAFSLDLCLSKNIEFLPVFGLETNLIEDPETAYEFSPFYQYGFVSAAVPLYLNYKHHGIQPHIFNESIIDFLHRKHLNTPITILVSHQEHGTDGTYKRDQAVMAFCKKNNILWYELAPSGVIRNLSSRDGRSEIVKKYLISPIIPIPNFKGIAQTPSMENDSVLDTFKKIHSHIGAQYNLHPTSEKAGLACLASFTTLRARGYRGGISSPNSALESGSRLSQYLAFGTLSVRYIDHHFSTQLNITTDTRLKVGIRGATQRLHWREHFIQRLETSPNMPTIAIHPDYNTISYNNQHLESYKSGNTGEPLIDACLRCLLSTGFINFRMRALLVSYAVFGLDIDWRDLGKFLATTFLDYEPGIHWSQIQMQAGVTGINTVRVYSPHKQILDQDPECIFIKKWIPELRDLTAQQIQNYNTSSLSELTEGTYPNPVVDFKVASKVNKAKTYGVRGDTTKESSQKVFIKHGSRKPRIKKTGSKKVLVTAVSANQTLF